MDSRRKDHFIVPDTLITPKFYSAEEQARLITIAKCVSDLSRLPSHRISNTKDVREVYRRIEEEYRHIEEARHQAQKKEHEHMLSFEHNLVEEIHAKHRGCKVSIDIIRSVE